MVRTYSIGAGVVATLFLLLNLALMPFGVSYEGVVAFRGIYVLVVWMAIVLMSYSQNIANHPDYRRLFDTNNGRWRWLVGLTLCFFIYCSYVGRGQPLLRSIYESAVSGVEEVQRTEVYQKNQNVVSNLGNGIWNFLELNNYKKVLVPEGQPKPKVIPRQQRAFFGLASWSHWLVLIFLYFPVAILYGIVSWRDEIGKWLEEKKNATPAGGHHAPSPSGEGGIATTGRVVKWLDFGVGIADFILNIVGAQMKKLTK